MTSTHGIQPPRTSQVKQTSGMARVRDDLRQRIQTEEATYGGTHGAPDTLMGHLERVAAHAMRLASQEGVDPLSAELAGLFHDAGKFCQGRYHEGDKPEEESSIEVLHELASHHDIDAIVTQQVAHAIRQLYRDDPDLTPLSRVLFDADNLDKLGLPGIANYFIRSGLRGHGLTMDALVRLTVELTYARHAPLALLTGTGRALAERRAQETRQFILRLLASLREDGVLDARVERTTVADLEIDLVVPSSCGCGAEMARRTWVEKGTKCTEIHLELACPSCDNRHKLRFCRPKLVV